MDCIYFLASIRADGGSRRRRAGGSRAAALRCSWRSPSAPAAHGGAGAAGPTLDGQPPSGTVELHEIQVAYIGNLGGGSGELTYAGETYSFDVAGLGVGGIGISSVDAEGEVYKPHRSRRFLRRLCLRAVWRRRRRGQRR